MLTKKKFDDIFEVERQNVYPDVTRFEDAMGFRVDKDLLENAARVLACPLKVNPPNWQHGRVIYAAAMERLHRDREGVFLDIGTAKGFSACVMSWAIAHCEAKDSIVTLDVIHPEERTFRNSVKDVDGPSTLDEYMSPFVSNGVHIIKLGCGSKGWLNPAIRANTRICFAFIDGKHTFEAVSFEIYRIVDMQKSGDVIVFDDLQIDPVNRAVRQLRGYDTTIIEAGPRRYMHAVKQ